MSLNRFQEDLKREEGSVCTPTDQISFWNSDVSFRRKSSSSSIASSVSNFPQSEEFSYTQFATNYKLSEKFEKHLLEIYEKFYSNPQLTPFSYNNPPSGILNRVTKEALKSARSSGCDIGIEIDSYSLPIIRQKLIQLCRASLNNQNIENQLNLPNAHQTSSGPNPNLHYPGNGNFSSKPSNLSVCVSNDNQRFFSTIHGETLTPSALFQQNESNDSFV